MAMFHRTACLGAHSFYLKLNVLFLIICFIQKASFLEIWIEDLCSSVGDTSSSVDEAKHASVDQKKDVIRRTIQSLIKVYESSKHHLIAHRFEKLATRLV